MHFVGIVHGYLVQGITGETDGLTMTGKKTLVSAVPSRLVARQLTTIGMNVNQF